MNILTFQLKSICEIFSFPAGFRFELGMISSAWEYYVFVKSLKILLNSFYLVLK